MSAAPAQNARRLQVAIWAAIMALALFLSLRRYDFFQIGVYSDDSVYVVLARSLLGDRGFGLINQPGGQPPVSPFPFGYPMILAPLVALAPANLDLLKLPSLLATCANGALLFWGWHWFSRRSRWWAVAVVGLYLLHPTVVSHSLLVMSEAVFTTLCLLSMLLAEQIARGRTAPWRAVLLGAVLVYAFYTRTVGFVLSPALAAYLIWRKGRLAWPSLGLAAAAGLILTVIILAAAPVGPDDLLPSRYLTERNNSAYLVVRQAGAALGAGAQSGSQDSSGEASTGALLLALYRAQRHLTLDLRQAVLPVNGQGIEQEIAQRLGIPWLGMVIALATLTLVIVGWWTWWTVDGMTAFGFGALVYVGAALLWNWSGPRLLLPVAPQLLLCFLIGLDAVWRFAGRIAAPRRDGAPAASVVPAKRPCRMRLSWLWSSC